MLLAPEIGELCKWWRQLFVALLCLCVLGGSSLPAMADGHGDGDAVAESGSGDSSPNEGRGGQASNDGFVYSVQGLRERAKSEEGETAEGGGDRSRDLEPGPSTKRDSNEVAVTGVPDFIARI